MKKKYIILSISLFIVLILSVTLVLQKTRKVGEFKVDGSNILDPNNVVFIPKGTNVNGMNAWWERETTQDIDIMKNVWKFNSVRVINLLKPEIYMNGFEGFQTNNDLDHLIKEFTSNEMVVMLELHDWTTKYPSEDTDPSLDDLKKWFTEMAKKYKNNTYVWFNIMNEPYGASNEQWIEIHEAAIKAIRDTGANNIIVCDNKGGSEEDLNKILDGTKRLQDTYGNIVFSTHVYSTTYGEDHVDMVHDKGVAFLYGEFGSDFSPDGNYRFTDAVLNTLIAAQNKNVGWFQWAWDGGDGFDLTDRNTTQGGGWEVDKTNGEKPTNLSWLGEMVWNASRDIELSYDIVDIAIEDITLNKSVFETGHEVDALITLRNLSAKPLNVGSRVVVNLFVDDKLVDEKVFDGEINVGQAGVILFSDIKIPSHEVTLKAEINIEASAFGDDVNQNNNVLTTSFNGERNVEGLKLAVESVGIEAEKESIEPNDEIIFKVVIKNIGSEVYKGTLYGNFYVNGNKFEWQDGTYKSAVVEEVELAPGETISLTTPKELVVREDVYLAFSSFSYGNDSNKAKDSINEKMFIKIPVVKSEGTKINLLNNGGFEKGMEGGWGDWGNTEITSVPNEIRSGNFALKVKAGAKGGAGMIDFKLKPNTTYILGAWGRCSGDIQSPIDMGIKFMLPNGDNPHFFLKFNKGQYEYKEVEFTTPEEFTEPTLFIWKDQENYDFMVDDIILYTKNESNNSNEVLEDNSQELIKNGDFEGSYSSTWTSWSGDKITTEEVYSGNKAFKASAGAPGGAGQFPVLESNTKYKFSFWAKCSGDPDNNIDIGVKYTLPDESTPHNMIQYLPGDYVAEWTYQEVIFETPNSFTKPTVFIWKDAINVDLFIDNVSLVKLNE